MAKGEGQVMMVAKSGRRQWIIAGVVMLTAFLGVTAVGANPWLLETQLAGVRLGDHIINYFGHKDGHSSAFGVRTWYGTPTGIVVAAAGQPMAPAAGVMPMAGGGPAAGAGGAAGAGVPPTAAYSPVGGVPAGFGGSTGEEQGPFSLPGLALPGAVPGMVGTGVSGSSYQGLEQSPALMMPSAGMAAFQKRRGVTMRPGAIGGGVAGAARGPGAMAVARPGVGPAVGAGQAAQPGAGPPPQAFPGAGAGGAVPIWATPIWFDLRTDAYGQPEVEYIYYKGGDVVVGIVCDSRGYITAVAVAGRECDFARTAMGDPERTIKLGDGFKKVIYRYGYPDRIETFSGGGPGTPFTGSVSFQGTSNVFERDCILYYDQQTPDGKEKNVAFTLHDMLVTRVHIWIPTEF